MTVDTAEILRLADCLEIRDDHDRLTRLISVLRCAADEIDELRTENDQLNLACVAHATEHAETKRELEQSKHQVQLSATSIEVLYKDLEKSRADLEALRQSAQATGWLLLGSLLALDEIRRGVEALSDNRYAASAHAHTLAKRACDDLAHFARFGGGT